MEKFLDVAPFDRSSLLARELHDELGVPYPVDVGLANEIGFFPRARVDLAVEHVGAAAGAADAFDQTRLDKAFHRRSCDRISGMETAFGIRRNTMLRPSQLGSNLGAVGDFATKLSRDHERW